MPEAATLLSQSVEEKKLYKIKRDRVTSTKLLNFSRVINSSNHRVRVEGGVKELVSINENTSNIILYKK